jgi:hypothetical protein
MPAMKAPIAKPGEFAPIALSWSGSDSTIHAVAAPETRATPRRIKFSQEKGTTFVAQTENQGPRRLLYLTRLAPQHVGNLI